MSPEDFKPGDRPANVENRRFSWSFLKRRFAQYSSQLVREFKNLISRRTSKLSIRQKIRYGYTLVLGIAVIGTTLGVVIGNHYQTEALQLQYKIREEKALLNNLQVAMLKARSQQKELAFYLLASPSLPDAKYNSFVDQVSTVKALLTRVQSSKLVANWNSLAFDISDYDKIVENYDQQVQTLIRRLPTENFSFDQPKTVEQRVFSLTYNPAFTQFDDLTDQLTKLAETATNQENLARANVEEARVLRDWTIASSILLSIGIAAFLVIYTSRAIAQPIEAVTQIARRVTEAADFSLRAKVLTRDEVGFLALSLNQLIQRVADYTQELEMGRQTLEDRVARRTQEVTRKNQELQETHDQLQKLYAQLQRTMQELQETQTQLIQTEKMSSLGQLVAGVAHEINNPVNFIYGNIDHIGRYVNDLLGLVAIYQQEYPRPSPTIEAHIEDIDLSFVTGDLEKTLTSIKTGADRIRQIVLSLRNFSRLDEAEMKNVDIHEGLDSTMLLIKHRLPEQVQIIEQRGNLPKVRCYPARLNQAFMNIINNAIDAVVDREVEVRKANIEMIAHGFYSGQELKFVPTIWIETEVIEPVTKGNNLSTSDQKENTQAFLSFDQFNQELPPPPPLLNFMNRKLSGSELPSPQSSQPMTDHQVIIRIKDNGVGIASEIQSKIFDPFFTTKPVGKATGLGLSVCYQIIQTHAGQLKVTSELGKGTEVIITLPITSF